MKRIIGLVISGAHLFAGPQPERLTLAEAEALALKNHPAIQAAGLETLASEERVNQARSARYPFVTANATAVAAQESTRIAAGGLNNPAIFSRFASGVSVSQTILDFGRTSKLIESARSAAAANGQRSEAARAEIVLAVRRAYFGVLRAENVMRVAQATVEARQLMTDQVSALVKAQLKSSLDLSFAETNLAEARLLASSASNERQAAYVQLSEALGMRTALQYELADVPDPNVEPLGLSEVRAQAIERRPELKALRLDAGAAREFAAAERAARFPAVSASAGLGIVPNAGPNLSSDYAAGGLNISLPFLSGGLYKARQAEAELRAGAAARRASALENRILRDVSTAWLDVNNAFERIGLTRQFVAQGGQALELAQTRYDLGLSSIVELSQAQLVKTNAELQYAAARYEYHVRRSVLEFQSGNL